MAVLGEKNRCCDVAQAERSPGRRFPSFCDGILERAQS
jgi:hypothetical protein